MSHIENVITTTFRARGNQAIAQMGQVAQGFGNVGRAIYDNTRMSERLNAQWRALGTTIRYAISGSVVFGLTRMVGQLRDIQQQAGLISAIGQQPGGLFGRALTDSQVTGMMNSLRNAAVQTLTPVQEVNDAATNFLSTVQNVTPSEVPGIITTLGQAAKLAQTPVDDLTKSVTSMNIAFGRKNDLSNIQAFSRMWFALISTAPGGPSAGGEIANQLPQVASMFMMGRGKNVSPEMGQAQMLSLVLGSLRTGATPATGIRGLTYLLQSIAQPTGGAKNALAGVGITPQMVEREGIYAALMKMLHQITVPSRGSVKQIVGMSDDTLNTLDSEGGSLPGISAGEMMRLRKMIPRIHGIRAAIILASQLQQHGDVSSLTQDLQLMNDAQNDQIEGALKMADAWKRFRNRAKLQKAAVAINAMALQVAQTFEPIMNFVGDRAAGLQEVMGRHQTATRVGVIGGAAFMAALGIGRFAGAGRLFPKGSLMSKILGGNGSLGNKLVQANAVQAALSGNAALGGSPQNPLYVVVVGEIFGNNTKGPTPGSGGLGDLTDTYVAAKVAKKGVGLLGRGGKLLGRLLGRGAGEIAYDTSWMAGKGGRFLPRVGGKVLGGAGIAAAFDYFYNADTPGGMAGEQKWIEEMAKLRRQFGSNVTGYSNPQKVVGKAEITLTLEQQGPGGKVTRRKVHVPMDMWAGGRVPTARGNAGTSRGG